MRYAKPATCKTNVVQMTQESKGTQKFASCSDEAFPSVFVIFFCCCCSCLRSLIVILQPSAASKMECVVLVFHSIISYSQRCLWIGLSIHLAFGLSFRSSSWLPFCLSSWLLSRLLSFLEVPRQFMVEAIFQFIGRSAGRVQPLGYLIAVVSVP